MHRKRSHCSGVFEIFVELDLAVDAGYVCSSLAEIQLACGEFRSDRSAGAQGARSSWRPRRRSPAGDRHGAASRWAGTRGAGLARRRREVDSRSRRDVSPGELVSHRSSAWIAQGDVERQRGRRRRGRCSAGGRHGRYRKRTRKAARRWTTASATTGGEKPFMARFRSSVATTVEPAAPGDWRGCRQVRSPHRRYSGYFLW